MGELKPEYEGRVEFEVVSLETEEGRARSEGIDFGGLRHGLVGIDRHGAQAVAIPGHNFGKEELQEKVEDLLR